DTALKTVTFRELQPPRPECTLIGVAYGQLGDSNDFTVNAGALTDPWFKGTGFLPGSTLHGLVGYEWNGIQPGCQVPPLTLFFHSEHQTGHPPGGAPLGTANPFPSPPPPGPRVFSASSSQFSGALDPLQERYAQRLDTFMQNALDALPRPAAPATAAA